MSSANIPPVQQAYFAKRREPVPYKANTTSGPENDGGYVDSAHAGSHQNALPAYAAHQAPDKVAVQGVGYAQFMATLQTIFQLGILVCMIAMVAKLYQSPTISSNSSRY